VYWRNGGWRPPAGADDRRQSTGGGTAKKSVKKKYWSKPQEKKGTPATEIQGQILHKKLPLEPNGSFVEPGPTQKRREKKRDKRKERPEKRKA